MPTPKPPPTHIPRPPPHTHTPTHAPTTFGLARMDASGPLEQPCVRPPPPHPLPPLHLPLVDAKVGLVCHPGYVAVMPFLLRLVDPESSHLGALLDVIGDPNQLW